MICRVVKAALVGSCLLAAACQKPDESADKPAGPPAAGPPIEEMRPMEAVAGEEVTNDKVRLAARQDGQRLFFRRCGVCHLGGGMGTQVLAMRLPPDQALLQNRTDLTEDYVMQVARNGIGAMPRLTRVEVTDAELRAIAQHLAKAK